MNTVMVILAMNLGVDHDIPNPLQGLEEDFFLEGVLYRLVIVLLLFPIGPAIDLEKVIELEKKDRGERKDIGLLHLPERWIGKEIEKEKEIEREIENVTEREKENVKEKEIEKEIEKEKEKGNETENENPPWIKTNLPFALKSKNLPLQLIPLISLVLPPPLPPTKQSKKLHLETKNPETKNQEIKNPETKNQEIKNQETKNPEIKNLEKENREIRIQERKELRKIRMVEEAAVAEKIAVRAQQPKNLIANVPDIDYFYNNDWFLRLSNSFLSSSDCTKSLNSYLLMLEISIPI